MLRDPQRGWAWTRALLGVVADEVHICGEAAAIELIKNIMVTTGEDVEVCDLTSVYTKLKVIKLKFIC